MRASSYFTGKIFEDKYKLKKDGAAFTTGTVLCRLNRGAYWLVIMAGKSAYILYKDKELK